MSFRCLLSFGLETTGALHSNYFHWGSAHILLLMLITDKEKTGGLNDKVFQALLLSQFLQSWQQLERAPSVIIPPQCNFIISSLLSIKKAKVAAHVMSKMRFTCFVHWAAGRQFSKRPRRWVGEGKITSFLYLCYSIWGNKCCYKHGEREGATA